MEKKKKKKKKDNNLDVTATVMILLMAGHKFAVYVRTALFFIASDKPDKSHVIVVEEQSLTVTIALSMFRCFIYPFGWINIYVLA